VASRLKTQEASVDRVRALMNQATDMTDVIAPESAVRAKTEEVLAAAEASGRGHVFNLGHGVLPSTDPDTLTRLVAHVHEATAR
jgi:uroporphyrinogen decarboxylase